MKQFFIIVAAILVSAGIIALVIGVYNAKVQNDEFKANMQKVNDDLKKAQDEEAQTNSDTPSN